MYAPKYGVRRKTIKRKRQSHLVLRCKSRNTRRRNKKKNISDFEIHGIRHITHRNSSTLRRSLWLFVTATTFMGCAYVSQERITRYLNDPSEINTFYVENKTIHFPAATFCPFSWDRYPPSINPSLYEQHFGNYSDEWFGGLFNTSKYTFTELWNVSRIYRENTQHDSFTDYFGTSSKKEYSVVDTDTIHGKCTTFSSQGPYPYYGVQSSQIIQFYGQNTHLKMFVIQFHTLEDIDLVRYLIVNRGIIYIYNSWDFLLRATEVNYRNTRMRPCSNDIDAVNQCVLECLENAVYSKVKKTCRLPYMMDRDGIPPCATLEEFKDIVSASIAVSTRFHKDDCNCSQKCREVIYNTELVLTSIESEDRNEFKLGMGFADPIITVLKEESAYNGFALFADIGGAIGLFLGISALDIFEILATFISRIIKH